MYESENNTMNPEEELVDILLDFIIVAANLAKSISNAMKETQIKEGGNVNEQNQRTGHGNQGLRSAAATINEVANTLEEMFSTTADRTLDAAVPAEPKLTLAQVRAVLADKSRKGHTAEIRTLLQKYGAAKLSGIDPANYKALLADVEVLTDGK